MITLAVGCGIGLGIGLWALLAWLRPPRPPLGPALAALRAPTTTAPGPGAAAPAGWLGRIGVPAIRPLAALGLPTAAIAKDLRLLGRSPQTYLAQKATLAVLGVLVPLMAQAMPLAAGVPLPWPVPALAGIAAAAVGFVVPDLDTRRRATRQRDSARHALSAYLSLVQITLAAGAGVEQALWDAASIGTGPTLARLRHALATARLTHTTPWASLARLGEDLDIAELTELAASMDLAGTEGTRVRASLAAQADAALTRQISTTEAAAHAATERMSMPVVLLAAGFLLFLGWPALMTVLSEF